MSNKKWRKAAPGVDTSTAAADPRPEDRKPVQEAQTAPRVDEPAVGAARLTQPAGAQTQPAKPRSSLPDQDAFYILDECCKLLHTLLGKALDAVNMVEPALLARVLKEAPEPEPQYGTPQKRPRGAAHPLMLLIKYAIAAGNTVPKLLRMTHSHLFGPAAEAAEAMARRTEGIVAGLRKMVEGRAVPAAT